MSATLALIALGSNLGDRAGWLDHAVEALDALPGCRVLQRSQWRESAPELPGDGGPYLNGALLLETTCSARALLEALLEIEAACGRDRAAGRGPRTLDLDLILFGATRSDQDDLILPHPRFRQRAFVLEPAAEVAPELRDPETGASLEALWARLRPTPQQG